MPQEDFINDVDANIWTRILLTHERMIPYMEAADIAESILPWYLMRVTSYLEDFRDPKSATEEIQQQFDLVVRKWNDEASPY